MGCARIVLRRQTPNNLKRVNVHAYRREQSTSVLDYVSFNSPIVRRQESKSGCSSYMSFSVKSFFHRHMFLIVIQQVVSVRKCRNECQSAGTGASTVDCLAAKSSASRAECGIPIFHSYCLKVCADDTSAVANHLLQASPSHR